MRFEGGGAPPPRAAVFLIRPEPPGRSGEEMKPVDLSPAFGRRLTMHAPPLNSDVPPQAPGRSPESRRMQRRRRRRQRRKIIRLVKALVVAALRRKPTSPSCLPSPLPPCPPS